jgi:hypothetical protein
MKKIILFIFLLSFIVTPVYATEVVLDSTDGNKLVSTDPTVNYHTDHIASGYYQPSGALARSLLNFDMSEIPSNATISDATLNLYDRDDVASTENNTIQIFRSLRDWSGTQSTWNIYKTGSNWGTAGSGNSTTDYESTVLGFITRLSTDTAGWRDFELDTDVIQEMITDGDYTNYGFLIKTQTENVYNIVNFDSSADTNKPTLTINYTTPEPTPTPTTTPEPTATPSAEFNLDNTSKPIIFELGIIIFMLGAILFTSYFRFKE